MSEQREKPDLTAEELEALEAEQLPDREAMSLISMPTIAPEPMVPVDGIAPPEASE